jgi:hypothetical protein
MAQAARNGSLTSLPSCQRAVTQQEKETFPFFFQHILSLRGTAEIKSKTGINSESASGLCRIFDLSGAVLRSTAPKPFSVFVFDTGYDHEYDQISVIPFSFSI